MTRLSQKAERRGRSCGVSLWVRRLDLKVHGGNELESLAKRGIWLCMSVTLGGKDMRIGELSGYKSQQNGELPVR